MTIRKGEDWGEVRPVPADAPVVSSDPALAQLVADRAGESTGELVVGLTGGDLYRTLGGRGDVTRRLGTEHVVVPVDVATVRIDGGRPIVFVAHVVARGPLWAGPTVIVMNAQWMGERRLAPRGHPGDGRLDITEGSLPLRERIIAARRARTGDHLPHPALRSSRVATYSVDLDRRRRIFVDGLEIATGRRLAIAMAPEPVHVVV